MTLAMIECGDELQSIKLPPVTRLDLIKYAGASGDYNPIHTIDEEATRAGLPGIIAHGMWTMGNVTKLFTPYLEEGFISSYLVRFKGMVFLGDVVTLHGNVQSRSDKKIIFKIKAVKQTGESALEGEATYTLYE